MLAVRAKVVGVTWQDHYGILQSSTLAPGAPRWQLSFPDRLALAPLQSLAAASFGIC